LIALLAHDRRAQIRLRIDDLDQERVRPEYVADIFSTLEWLGIEWNQGAMDMGEVERFSQTQRIARYNDLISALIKTRRIYGCACSRAEVTARANAADYDGYCRNRNLDLQDAPVLRFARLESSEDPIVRRRDGLPAYHVASLADDIDFGVNLIIRGEDLRTSTGVQRELAIALGPIARNFLSAEILHHPLIADAEGRKLSKSVLGSGRAMVKDEATRELVYQSAHQILKAFK